MTFRPDHRLGYFGKASAPHGWLDGDFNGDGKVTPDDIGIIIAAEPFTTAATRQDRRQGRQASATSPR